MKKFTPITAVLLGIAALAVQQAKADTISFNISTGNSALNLPYTGPYATVTVNLTSSTTATITFTSLTQTVNGQSCIYLFGDGSSVAVNVNASSWTLSGISANTLPGFNTPMLTNGGSGNVDGFGVLNQTLNNFDGFAHATNQITFTLTNTSGTWANAKQVLRANGQGALAAAHIFVTLNPANLNNGAIVTGFAANGGAVPSVPDGGATVMLLGAALGALGMVRRYLIR